MATPSAPFVLVHGAWAGGWSMQRLARRLVAAGHEVHAPTLSGLGERSHLAGPGIGLHTHVDDVVNEVLWKDLRGVVLVGASYAGLVITGAAERLGDRLAALVHVDAFIPDDGQSFVDMTGLKVEASMVPAPDVGDDDYETAADRAWIRARATAQPAGTFTEKLRVSGAWQRVPKKLYVQATGWKHPSGRVDRLRADPAWTVAGIDCAHDIANIRPDELAALLRRAAA